MEKVDQQQTPAVAEQTGEEAAAEMESSAENAVEEMDASLTDTSAGPSADDEPEADEESMDSLMALYEESLKRFEEGEVVNGRIISIDKDHVLVDIGYKSEGQVGIHEFVDEAGNVQAEIDDTVEVMVEWWDDENEVVLLSKEKAAKVKVWEALKVAFDNEEPVEGTITNRVKGGFSVDVGVRPFFPVPRLTCVRCAIWMKWWGKPSNSKF